MSEECRCSAVLVVRARSPLRTLGRLFVNLHLSIRAHNYTVYLEDPFHYTVFLSFSRSHSSFLSPSSTPNWRPVCLDTRKVATHSLCQARPLHLCTGRHCGLLWQPLEGLTSGGHLRSVANYQNKQQVCRERERVSFWAASGSLAKER